MRRRRGPLPFELLLLLALLTLQGDGNEGSIAGSCRCNTRFPSDSPPTVHIMKHFRKQLRGYDRCGSYVRFQLHSRSVCGGSKDQWVHELISCFDRKECGRGNLGRVAHREHLPPPSTQAPEPTERASSDVVTPAQTYLPSTLQPIQQSTRPAATPSLDKSLIHANETTASTLGHSLVSAPEAGENQKQLKEHVGSAIGTSVTVAVPSLLAIVFFLTGVLLYVLCKKREKTLRPSPDLQAHYERVAPD
ncbi:C-X-C motif chemokine 16 [Equus quagga]|uniref:C-X-C motif chemokine 16 n=1 Tax=Equus quagga TaxID=89248 RepID=UPI001EE25576|nr:C-X-C motif chemokine 16 [Equus quagga]XP_046533664.1 C-X-C motif chemokine 16 [Equus quagga]XP_046533665.1 C-X-C motif chemokine 16 [Equus quagga]